MVVKILISFGDIDKLEEYIKKLEQIKENHPKVTFEVDFRTIAKDDENN